MKKPSVATHSWLPAYWRWENSLLSFLHCNLYFSSKITSKDERRIVFYLLVYTFGLSKLFYYQLQLLFLTTFHNISSNWTYCFNIIKISLVHIVLNMAKTISLYYDKSAENFTAKVWSLWQPCYKCVQSFDTPGLLSFVSNDYITQKQYLK